ncbi:MAG: hypothetical protein Q9197_001850 [Variospora fuerteventurae]
MLKLTLSLLACAGIAAASGLEKRSYTNTTSLSDLDSKLDDICLHLADDIHYHRDLLQTRMSYLDALSPSTWDCTNHAIAAT